MNATEALQLTKAKIPEILDKEYEQIMSDIKRRSDKGETDLCFGFSMPKDNLVSRLRSEGYNFYRTGDNFLLPYMYSVSWKKERKPKKKWHQRLFTT